MVVDFQTTRPAASAGELTDRPKSAIKLIKAKRAHTRARTKFKSCGDRTCIGPPRGCTLHATLAAIQWRSWTERHLGLDQATRGLRTASGKLQTFVDVKLDAEI